MTTYVIVTISLTQQDYEIRKKEYTTCINQLINIKKLNDNIKVVLVENVIKGTIDQTDNKEKSPSCKTFLDDFNLPVLYTNNNNLKTNNKGNKELQDVFDCIHHFGIKDEDFIVKITGRYYFNNHETFFKNINSENDCIIKYGPYMSSDITTTRTGDCITGLIGMRCKYVKQIEFLNEYGCIEWNWAKTSLKIPEKNVCILPMLDMFIAPGSHSFFLR